MISLSPRQAFERRGVDRVPSKEASPRDRRAETPRRGAACGRVVAMSVVCELKKQSSGRKEDTRTFGSRARNDVLPDQRCRAVVTKDVPE